MGEVLYDQDRVTLGGKPDDQRIPFIYCKHGCVARTSAHH